MCDRPTRVESTGEEDSWTLGRTWESGNQILREAAEERFALRVVSGEGWATSMKGLQHTAWDARLTRTTIITA